MEGDKFIAVLIFLVLAQLSSWSNSITCQKLFICVPVCVSLCVLTPVAHRDL